MTVGGVDTYYDYEQQRWMHRRLGGGPVRPDPPTPSEHTKQARTAAQEKKVGKATAEKS